MTPALSYAEVIGDPIAQSLSPVIHGFWLEALDIPGEYRRFQVTQSGLPAYLAERRADSAWRGANVTMPLKLDATGLADGASDRAVAAGAANLLLPRDGKLFAANTDVGAIAALVDRQRKAGRLADSVTLLGTGGAARAALVALKLLDIDHVRIQARDVGQAKKLAVEFALALAPAQLTATIDGDALINATPLGMAGYDCLNCDVTKMPDHGFVFDMVASPSDTPLIAAARARGLAMVTGLEMLVEQAASSFKLLFGVEPPRDRDAELWQRLRP
ncbi:MAG: shikimate dehydrogenase [Pseudomonadota bacterium]|nr:shikimate dehydrogenase [Pseudomonadota bacterium]